MTEAKPFPDVPDLLDVIGQQPEDKTCAVFDQRVLSYGELRAKMAGLSAQLSGGFTLILVQDPIDTLIAWLGCYHRGVSTALIDPKAYAQDGDQIDAQVPYEQVVTDTAMPVKATAAVVHLKDVLPGQWSRTVAQRDEGVLVLGSSRTTGKLKLIAHEYADLPKHRAFWHENYPLIDGDLLAVPKLIPFGYGFITSVLWAIWSGKACCFPVNLGEKGLVHAKTTVSCLPAAELANLAFYPALRLAVSSGSQIRLHTWDWFRGMYRHTPMVNLVGATENLTPYLYSESPDTFRFYDRYQGRVVDQDGKPMIHVPGLIEFKGIITPRYWGNQAQQESVVRDGWIRLGDYAIDNGDGTFKFLGRNTVSFDLENALNCHPGIKDCHFTAIRGFPFLLVASEGLDRATIMELVASFGVKLNDKGLVLVDSIPRNENGKLQHAVVEGLIAKSKRAEEVAV